MRTRKILAAALAAVILAATFGFATPAEAKESGWGCGGACRVVVTK